VLQDVPSKGTTLISSCGRERWVHSRWCHNFTFFSPLFFWVRNVANLTLFSWLKSWSVDCSNFERDWRIPFLFWQMQQMLDWGIRNTNWFVRDTRWYSCMGEMGGSSWRRDHTVWCLTDSGKNRRSRIRWTPFLPRLSVALCCHYSWFASHGCVLFSWNLHLSCA